MLHYVETLEHYADIMLYYVETLEHYADIMLYYVETLEHYADIMLHYVLSIYKKAFSGIFYSYEYDFFVLAKIKK